MHISFLFPYKLQLNILQIEGYKTKRFLKWVFKNLLKRKIAGKKKLVWTTKAKIIYFLSIFYASALSVLLYILIGLKGFVLGIILSTQPCIFLSLSAATLKPYEFFNRYKTKKRTAQKILKYKRKKLKVIGITGSYGKTSTKEFLYQILKTQYKVLKTPESYNTLFGAAKVVDFELDDSYNFFICEMGAYKEGEIKELCEIVAPDFGIITGINEQHLERFGSLENTIKAKFELARFVRNEKHILLNKDCELINSNSKNFVENPTFYGKSEKFSAKNIRCGGLSTTFTLILDRKEYKIKTNLIGKNSIYNVLAASSMAYILGVKPKNILSAIEGLKGIPHRNCAKELADGTIVIDNAYSSNTTGFIENLNLLRSFHKHTKILATPGVVELGKKSLEFHKAAGRKIDKTCDFVFLIGKSERTNAIYSTIKDRKKVLFLNSIQGLFPAIKKLGLKTAVVLIENDLPDNY